MKFAFYLEIYDHDNSLMNYNKTSIQTQSDTPSLIEQRWFLYAIIVTQILVRPIVWLLAPLFIYRTVVLLKPEQLQGEKPFIISSNHQCRIDHFLILVTLPWRSFLRLLPYRFFTANDLFIGPLHPILLLCGSFPAFQHPRWPYGLDIAQKLIKKNQTIFIFPEGKRSQWRQRPARSGVAVLSQTVDCNILPVSILWKKRGWLRQCSVVIGEPVAVGNRTAQEILDLSFELGPHHLKS